MLISSNINSKKVLLILVGQMRTAKYLYNDILSAFSKLNPTVVISTWEDDNVSIDKLVNYYNPAYIDIEKYHKSLTFSEVGPECWVDDFAIEAESTRAMWYKFGRCVNIVKELEENSGVKFETIVKFRVDIMLLSKVSIKKSDGYIFFENTGSDVRFQRSDRFFYGDRDLMLSIFREICPYTKNRWSVNQSHVGHQLLPVGERVFKQFIEYKAIKARFFFPAVKIWRFERYPNTWDKLSVHLNRAKRYFKRVVLRFDY
jgi:hypothetical protein